MTRSNRFRGFRTSLEIIRLAVMMFVRFPLSLRNVEDLLHERGIDVCHETVRFWWHRFGPDFASGIRTRRIEGMRSSHRRWHLDEMQMMAESTLAFARGDAEAEPTTEIDLADVLQDLVKSSDPAARISLEESLPSVIVRGRLGGLRRALRNLVENALRYGGGAEIALWTEQGEAFISISDHGPGLPEDRLESVFEPFRRMEGSRSRETGGAGLGLSIARTVLRAHGGDVTLENRTGGGLTATVRLPL